MLHEKHYPHVNADQILERRQNKNGEKLPLLAMAGLFDINEHCEVSLNRELTELYSIPLE